jgi:hypothetical protein
VSRGIERASDPIKEVPVGLAIGCGVRKFLGECHDRGSFAG